MPRSPLRRSSPHPLRSRFESFRSRIRSNRSRWRIPLTRRMARHPLAWWALVVCAALTVGLTSQNLLTEAAQARDGWGEQTTVLVVQSELERGESVAASVAPVVVPMFLSPRDVIIDVPRGAVAAATLTPGEILVQRHLGSLDSAPPGELPVDAVGVSIPRSPSTPDLSVGDRVDVLATFDPPPGVLRSQVDTFTVASRSTVMQIDDQAVRLALSRDEALQVAGALSGARITLVLVGA